MDCFNGRQAGANGIAALPIRCVIFSVTSLSTARTGTGGRMGRPVIPDSGSGFPCGVTVAALSAAAKARVEWDGMRAMTFEQGAAEDALAQLRRALPGVKALSADEELQAHRWDRALDPNAGVPLAVLLPRSTEDVQAIVRYGSAHGIPLVPRGAGSGLSGGASAVDGCLVVSMAEMTDYEIDPVTRMATVQPGIINADLKAAAAAEGLWYPPDPASVGFSSIGGNVATNAGGLCCVKYGVTTDYVLGVTVVLADGAVVNLGGPRLKEAAGLSLTKLFVGSEGTLGIITSIVLRLIPPPPPACTVVATFSELDASCQAVLEVASTVRASMLE